MPLTSGRFSQLHNGRQDLRHAMMVSGRRLPPRTLSLFIDAVGDLDEDIGGHVVEVHLECSLSSLAQTKGRSARADDRRCSPQHCEQNEYPSLAPRGKARRRMKGRIKAEGRSQGRTGGGIHNYDLTSRSLRKISLANLSRIGNAFSGKIRGPRCLASC